MTEFAASLGARRAWLLTTGAFVAAAMLGHASLALAASDTAVGDVTKVDRDPPRLTIRHGELKALDMPAMTMAFRLQSPTLADGVKPGDRVRFTVEKINGQYVLTRVEPAK
jgi:Cu(I)/Ag(I) efflux system periplasmic protein CusF